MKTAKSLDKVLEGMCVTNQAINICQIKMIWKTNLKNEINNEMI